MNNIDKQLQIEAAILYKMDLPYNALTLDGNTDRACVYDNRTDCNCTDAERDLFKYLVLKELNKQ